MSEDDVPVLLNRADYRKLKTRRSYRMVDDQGDYAFTVSAKHMYAVVPEGAEPGVDVDDPWYCRVEGLAEDDDGNVWAHIVWLYDVDDEHIRAIKGYFREYFHDMELILSDHEDFLLITTFISRVTVRRVFIDQELPDDLKDDDLVWRHKVKMPKPKIKFPPKPDTLNDREVDELKDEE
ncbi:hypothetical protein MKEN_00163800 [Mycena kentingensis (nom. inval.)]|nr:hypothetical protein MKEN_00163800 [Mycena kentingensis (nom. inval.)]